MSIILAFIGGIIGSFTGTTVSFVIYGLVGIWAHFMPSPFFDPILQIMLVPCVCFGGGMASYALIPDLVLDLLKNREWKKAFLKIFAGGVFGVIWYGFLCFFNALPIGKDAGALVVVTSGILTRLLLARNHLYSGFSKRELREQLRLSLRFRYVLVSLVLCLMALAIVQWSGNVSLPFYIAAVSLLLIFTRCPYVLCHHTVLVASYAYSVGLPLLGCVLFGLLAMLICQIMIPLVNMPQSGRPSHIDGPAIAIGSLSLIILNL